MKKSNTRKSCGELVRSHRQAKGMTQAELGDAVGISRTGVSAIEGGKANNIETIRKIAAALGVKPKALMPDDRG